MSFLTESGYLKKVVSSFQWVVQEAVILGYFLPHISLNSVRAICASSWSRSTLSRVGMHTGDSIHHHVHCHTIQRDMHSQRGRWEREEIYEGEWLDIGTPQRLELLNAQLINQY